MSINLKYLLLSSFIVIAVSTSCEDDLVVEPYCEFTAFAEILSLTEIIDFIPIDRMDEILDCKQKDIFRFTGSCGEISIINEPNNCKPESEIVGGTIWVENKVEMGRKVLNIELEHPYILHDSLSFGRTIGNGADQFYEIVRSDKNIIILQTHPELSIPKTKNIWQLTLAY